MRFKVIVGGFEVLFNNVMSTYFRTIVATLKTYDGFVKKERSMKRKLVFSEMDRANDVRESSHVMMKISGRR